MQNMHRQIFPLSILDTLFLLGQQVLKILKSLLDVTPTTIHITDCIVATFVVEAIKLRLKLFLFTASKTQRLKGQAELKSLLASTLYAKKGPNSRSFNRMYLVNGVRVDTNLAL